MSEENYASVREILKDFINCTLVGITQHDFEDFKSEGKAFIYLHFSNGRSMYVEIKGDEEESTFAYDSEDED